MKIHDHSTSAYIVTDFTLEGWQDRTFCVFDLEGTGPDPLNDAITQIGAVKLGRDGSVIQQFQTLVRPDKLIPAAIEKLTGITNALVEAAPRFSNVIHDFLAFANGCVLVTQAGYEYDLPLLQEECRHNHIVLGDLVVLDTKALFSYLHPEVDEIVSTNFLIRYYGIDDLDIRRHDALGDSVLIARILNRMLETCRQRGILNIAFDNLTVKKVKLAPLNE